MTTAYFTTKTMTFLRKLAQNNNRDWFQDNKQLYEEHVRTPALAFITDIADDLAQISPHFRAQPKKVGGSLMRIYRDVRFSRDKQPYKTNIGIHFRHERAKDVHAPGFYLHIEPNDCFIGVGIWRPDNLSLGLIRDYICARDKQWLAAINKKSFKNKFLLSGESLTRPPRGYAKDHPLIEDLKRKDFIAIVPKDNDFALAAQLKKQVINTYKAADDYMRFLCAALELQY